MTTTPTTPPSENFFNVAHATSLLAEDAPAFEHSVAIALAVGAPLYTVHATDGRYNIVEMPRASALLDRWGAGPLRHHTINHACCDGTVDTLLDAMKTVDPDLLVVGKREGDSIIDHLLEESVSEALARNLPIPTLVIPSLSSGFVNPRTGETTVEHVLVPCEDEAAMLPALSALVALFSRMNVATPHITLLHVGDESLEELALLLPEDAPVDSIEFVTRTGSPKDAILELASELDVDMIAMSTRGHDSLLDIARGSLTERVMREAKRPVLTIPIKR
jgi:nucleotide-binding universal stress UspA family protein